MPDLNAWRECRDRLRQRLLDERTPDGHWEGELSSSALSTATALFALRLAGERPDLVAGGVRWLIAHRNPDGGWGDTVRSRSNLSTTALCWAALVGEEGAAETVREAEAWLRRAAGTLEPAGLAAAIAARYGRDRTFSVPILTMCALAGRLGPGPDAWRHVPALPFELAALPREVFRWLRLPVVSYALPALIAIGQAGHTRRTGGNPALRRLRDAARDPTLRVLTAIQPEGGGFLEATPLTSFVAMSLVGAGRREHLVTREALAFLSRSARPDGSWPIDSNLATWVTTLALNALGPEEVRNMPTGERDALRDWILSQQYRRRHPYTGAAPGGWAWTDLPGGVPDADDTPGAILARGALGVGGGAAAAAAGIAWLLDLQNADGGMPTFCRGWGALPFDRSGADLTAHALLAWRAWRGELPPALRRRTDAAAGKALRYLQRTQRADGAWVPLWFGNEDAPEEQNPTYGTARVLPALLEWEADVPGAGEMRRSGVEWLLRAQGANGGWSGDAGGPPSVEETGLAVTALARAAVAGGPDGGGLRDAVARGTDWLVRATSGHASLEPSPIGFYFAKLWYSERLYPLVFACSAFTPALQLFDGV